MRLIDANKFRQEYCEHCAIKYDCKASNGGWQRRACWTMKLISLQPTIEAIPIEWLKQWEEKHKDDPCYCGFVSDEIIKDWRLENGKV